MGFEQIQVQLIDTMGSDRGIAETAWTSSLDQDKKQNRTEEEVKRVINLMANGSHGTPFESVIFKFWMRIPIFTDRQVVTHRIASHNGLSGRYRTLPSDYYSIPDDVKEMMKRVETVSPPISNQLTNNLEFMHDAAIAAYNDMIYFSKQAQDAGIITNKEYKRIREIARGVVPTGGMTERTTIFNLRSFANYQKLRNSDHAQPEIRHVAKLMLNCVKEKNVCPIAISALEAKGWVI